METKSFFKSTSLLHMALLSGQLIMLAVMIFLIKSFQINTAFGEDMMLLVVPLIALAAYFLGNKFYESRIAGISSNNSTEEKLATFRSAFIIRLAFLEGVTLMSIMMYFISSNFLYMLISCVLLIYFYSLKPTLSKIKTDAQLSAIEAESI